MDKLINISQLSKLLNLVDKNSNKPLNYILRYWEKEFKQINPKIINNRRYYSLNQVRIIKKIKYLLKDKGLTVSGVKKALNTKRNDLDYRNNLEDKTKELLKKINKLKKYGKKKTHVKVRLVPESNPDSKFIYYAKKPTKGEKAKDKLKLKKYNPNTRKHEIFVEKKIATS